MYFESTNIYLIIAIAAVTITLLVIVGLFVYNHFAGIQTRTMLRIDQKMEAAGSGDIQQKAAQPDAAEDGNADAEKTEEPVPVQQKEDTAAADMLSISPKPETKEEKEFGHMPYSRGRSGRVYTREELEVQIRD